MFLLNESLLVGGSVASVLLKVGVLCLGLEEVAMSARCRELG
jgi:hypothetical protein